jgi:vancomycin resistance protein YoaR
MLLTLSYMQGKTPSRQVSWKNIEKPALYSITLKPNESFAFHDSVLPEFKEKQVKTTNSHFNASEGFKSDGYLYGDGVCHLASLIYWVAKDAHLKALAPANHDFRAIPEIPKEYGVAIYASQNKSDMYAKQNLYITNTLSKTITIAFEYKNNSTLSAAIIST